MINAIIGFCIRNRIITICFFAIAMAWGVYSVLHTAVDAIPDIGENQQVIFTDWPGRSPQDVEDQITYPLTTTMQGTPGFKTIRSFSMFGFSVVYVIFDDDFDFYWCRTRLLEKQKSSSKMTYT